MQATYKIAVIMAMLLVTAGTTAAMDAPAMWMEQDNNTVSLMVNSTDESSGMNAWIHFDPTFLNVTVVDYGNSPWQPMEAPGWSNQGDYARLVAVNMTGVAAGKYTVATFVVEEVGNATSTEIGITHAEPIGVVPLNLSYLCSFDANNDTDDNTTTNNEADDNTTVINDSVAIIGIGAVSGATTAPITITNGDDVGAVDITLHYDPAVVMVTSVGDGAMDCTYVNMEKADEGWVRIGATQGSNVGLIGDNTLVDVTFEPVSYGECALELSVETFKDESPECLAMPYSISNGSYTRLVFINGDANQDGVVDIVDPAYIAKHLIGIVGYEEIDAEAANVNGDTILDMADSMYLTKHVMGEAGFEELR